MRLVRSQVLEIIVTIDGFESGSAVAQACFAASIHCDSRLGKQCQDEGCHGDLHFVEVWSCLERRGGSREEMVDVEVWCCLTRVESGWRRLDLMTAVELDEMRGDAGYFRGVRSMSASMEQKPPSSCSHDMVEPPEPFSKLGVMRRAKT
jgi:hypothetical protein